ncbi:MAG: hypothetical protein FJX66_16640, partial [Alphaproteobacteria bacterium]|nr:hypothetical protein [Alphaproteobacteria bacterium]
MSLDFFTDPKMLAPARTIRTDLRDGAFVLRSPDWLRRYDRCVGEWLERLGGRDAECRRVRRAGSVRQVHAVLGRAAAPRRCRRTGAPQSRPERRAADRHPVGQLVGLMAHPGAPFNLIKELVGFAKANPGKLSYVALGAGGTPHLAVELLNVAAGIDLVHVPYTVSAPAQIDVIAWRVQLMSDLLITAMPHLREGNMKVLAVSSEKRAAGFEQFPLSAETFPGFDVSAYLGSVVPAATARAVERKIRDDSVWAVNLQDVKARIAELGNEIVGSTPEEFDRLIAP